MEAFTRQRLQQLTDSATDKRWPELATVLCHDGVRAVLSVPVESPASPEGSQPTYTVGTLNIYLTEPREWDQSELNAVQIYGRLVGSLLGTAVALELQGQLVRQLQWALDHRVVVEQAKGVLMGRDGLQAAAAYERIRAVARASRRPVADVARDVVSGGRWASPRKPLP